MLEVEISFVNLYIFMSVHNFFSSETSILFRNLQILHAIPKLAPRIRN